MSHFSVCCVCLCSSLGLQACVWPNTGAGRVKPADVGRLERPSLASGMTSDSGNQHTSVCTLPSRSDRSERCNLFRNASLPLLVESTHYSRLVGARGSGPASMQPQATELNCFFLRSSAPLPRSFVEARNPRSATLVSCGFSCVFQWPQSGM